MKESVLKGGIILVVAGILGKILGAFYRIPLSNILGAEGIGVYQMIFPVFSLALIICSGGVSVSISHAIAKIRASGIGSIKQVFLKGFFYSLFTSIVFAIIFFILGDKIATIQGNSLAGFGYKVSALALIFSSLLAPFRGLFQGFQNMTPTATSQILEQVFKVIFGLVFALFFVQTSLELGVVGAFLGIAIAEIISFFYLFFKTKTHKFEFFSTKKENTSFFRTNFVITSTYLIIPLLTAFDSFVVINLLSKFFSSNLSTSLYGIQSGMINSLINFPVVISVAISLAILPTLTFHLTQNDNKKASEIISKIFTILLLFLLPCILIFIFFSKDILTFIYPSLGPELLETASLLLKISAFQILFISILQICTAVFQSLDKPVLPIYFMSVAGVIKIILTILLVKYPGLNIYGLAISNLIFYVISATPALYYVKNKLPFSLKTKTFSVIVVSLSILCTSFWILNVYAVSFWVKILFTTLITLTFYIFPLLIFDLLEIKHILKQKFLKWRTKNE